MINTVRDIGNRTEEVSRYDSAAQRGDEIVIAYAVRIWSYNHTPCHYSLYPSQSVLAEEVPRWGVVNLDAGWTELDEQLGINWGKRELIRARGGPRPTIDSREYAAVPVSKTDWYHQPHSEYPSETEASQHRARQLRHCVDRSPYCVNSPYGYANDEFFVVSRAGDSDAIRFKLVRVPPVSYFASWATPVHIVLYPLALALDIASFPVQLPLLYGYTCMP